MHPSPVVLLLLLLLLIALVRIASAANSSVVPGSTDNCSVCCSHGWQLLRDLSPGSLQHFADHLSGDDDFVRELEGQMSKGPVLLTMASVTGQTCSYVLLCFRYIVGSVVAFGRVDQAPLGTIRRCYPRHYSSCLSDLIDRLLVPANNSLSGASQFVADTWERTDDWEVLRYLISITAQSHMSQVSHLIVEAMGICEGNKGKHGAYCQLLQLLPLEMQYRAISECHVQIEACAGPQFNHRGLFFMTLLNPNQAVRDFCKKRCPDYCSSDIDHYYDTSIVLPCPDGLPALPHDLWQMILSNLSIYTQTCVLQLVCKAWKLHSGYFVSHSAKIQNWFLQDWSLLNHLNAPPWRTLLGTQSQIYRYFGWCILQGALGRAIGIDDSYIALQANQYLDMLSKGRLALPLLARKDDYEKFVAIFEAIYKFSCSIKPRLDKPSCLSAEDYERAIRHFRCTKRWEVVISPLYYVCSLPKLFDLIGDDELFVELLVDYFSTLDPPCANLLVLDQACKSSALTKLIFSHSPTFSLLLQTTPDGYREAIITFGLLPDILSTCSRWHLDKKVTVRYVVSVLLSCRNRPDLSEKLIRTLQNRFNPLLSEWKDLTSEAVLEFAGDNCRADDYGHVVDILRRSGLIGEH